MSFLRHLPLIVRRIPPPVRRSWLRLRGPWSRLRPDWTHVPALRWRSRSTRVVNAVLATLLLVAVALSYRTLASADAATTDAGTAGTSLVTMGPVTATVTAIGAVESAAMANIGFPGPGKVTEIDVKIGDTVKKDQVLAKIDADQAQEQLRTAKSNLSSAQQSLSRLRSATNDASTIAFAQAQVTSAQSNLSAAQRAVDGSSLTAPMDGTVIAVNGTVGAWWNATTGGGTDGSAGSSSNGAAFIQIADVTKLQVSTAFPEVDAMKVKAEQPATVTWAALSGTRVAGRVTAIAPAATNQNNVNSYPVTVSLASLPDGVRIGQTVTVVVTVAEVDGVVRVPATAVRRSGDRHTAEVLRPDGTRQTRTLEIGLQGDQFVEIVSGLAVNERVTSNQGGSREN